MIPKAEQPQGHHLMGLSQVRWLEVKDTPLRSVDDAFVISQD